MTFSSSASAATVRVNVEVFDSRHITYGSLLCTRFAVDALAHPFQDPAVLAKTRPEEWLLIEWPEGEEAPTKYWFSTLPANIGFRQLVDTAKLRWRIERDYHELKQEIGLGHFEGRGWRGFHHHATLCIAAYGFLVSERSLIPPSGVKTTMLKAPPLPKGYRPRGSAGQTRTPRQVVNYQHPH